MSGRKEHAWVWTRGPEVRGPPEVKVGGPPCHSPPCLLRQHLSLILDVTSAARLAGQWAPETHLSLPSLWEVTDMNHVCLSIYTDSRDISSGPHAYIVSLLRPESPPQYPRVCFSVDKSHSIGWVHLIWACLRQYPTHYGSGMFWILDGTCTMKYLGLGTQSKHGIRFQHTA